MIDNMKLILNSCKELLIAPKGKSMRPYLMEKRDKVVVSPINRNLNIYDIVLYKSNDIYILHRVIGENEDSYLICGDNNYVTETIPKDDIIGVVTEIIRFDRFHITTPSKSFDIWAKVWYEWKFKKVWNKINIIFQKIKRIFIKTLDFFYKR